MMGRQKNDQGQLFYSFHLDEAGAGRIISCARSPPFSICRGFTPSWRPTIPRSAGPRSIRCS